MKHLKLGNKEQRESSSTSLSTDKQPLIINTHAQSHYVFPMSQVSQSHPTFPFRHNEEQQPVHKINRVYNRKGSIDSRQSSKNSKNRGVSPSESQQRFKQGNDQNRMITGQNSQQKNMKRPNSAKNLKPIHNVNSNTNLRTMITSPTLATLQREPSHQQLPPKPKYMKNNMLGKSTEFMYQSMGTHPIAQPNSVSQSINKRGQTGCSQERPRTAKVEVTKKAAEDTEQQTFSPLRRKNNGMGTTQPKQSSGQKGITDFQSNVQKKKTQQSQQRSKSRKPQGADIASPMSPNIERIRPQDLQEVKETNAMDSFDRVRRSAKKVPQTQSFEMSAIKKEQHDSQDDSLGMNALNKGRQMKATQMQENYAGILKTIKQHIQSISINEEERKRRKVNEKKEKLLKEQERTRKVNLEHFKQQMQKKIDGASKNTTIKRKVLSSKNVLSDQDILKQKKQETREQWQKEREERHQCLEMVRDALRGIPAPNQKRQLSKSQQRPFSAMPITSQESSQNQLLVKVPQIEINETLAQSQIKSDVSPLRDQRFDHNQNIESAEECLKRQKKERSKRKKEEKMKALKKELFIVQLKDQQQKKQFEIFKQHIKAAQVKSKIKTKAFAKTMKNSEYYQTTQQPRQPLRSKSKKKIDEEKENRRVCISPKNTTLKSGGRSKSDARKPSRKNSNMTTTSDAQLLQLTQKLQKAGVFDIAVSKSQEGMFQIKYNDSILRKSNITTGIKSADNKDEQTPSTKMTKKKDEETHTSLRNVPQISYFQGSNSLNNNTTHQQPLFKSVNFGTEIQQMLPLRDSYQNLHDQLPRMNANFQSVQNLQTQILSQDKNQQVPVEREDVKSQKKQKKKNIKVSSGAKDQNSLSKVQSPTKIEPMIPKSQQPAQKKGSESFKRNQPIASSQNFTSLPSAEAPQQSEQPDLRPKSAKVQKINLLDIIQQQKHLKEQQQKAQEEAILAAVLTIQTLYRKYRARKAKESRVLKTEVLNIRQDQLQRDQGVKNEDAHLKSLTQKDIVPASNLEHNNEDSFKLSDKEEENKSSKREDSINNDVAISKSQANFLKQLLTQEQKQRPKTSGQQRQIKVVLDTSQKSSSSKADSQLITAHKKVNERLEYQITINQKHEEQANQLKRIINIESLSSLQNELNPTNLVYSHLTPLTSNLDQDIESISSGPKYEGVKQFEVKSQSRKLSEGERSRTEEKKQQLHSQIIASSSFQGQNHDNWQFERRSFQDYFEQNSQVMKEKKIALVGQGELDDESQNQGKFSVQKKFNQYEDMLEQLNRKNIRDKEELSKLQQKRHLSPKSKQKMSQLEKWVPKQEEQLTNKRQWYADNVNEIISKIDEELKITKSKIGSSKKGSQLINTSVDWSHDQSIGHLSSSSILSTPRLTKLPTKQQSQVLQQQQVTDRAQKKQAFDYKLPTKTDSNLVEELKEPPVSKPKGEINELSNIENIEKIESKHKSSLAESETDLIQTLSSIFKKEDAANVFEQNLLSSQISQPGYLSGRSSQVDNESVGKIIIEELMAKDDQASIPKEEPPQFQSPVLSVISPKDPEKNFTKFDDDNQEPIVMQSLDENQESVSKQIFISPLSSENNTQEQISELGPHIDVENIKNKLELQFIQEEDKEEEKEEEKNQKLIDAFNQLKEPEQIKPLSEGPKEKDRLFTEQQTNFITEFIMMHLVDQIKNNLFPKRPIIHKPQLLISVQNDKSLEKEISPSASQSQIEILSFPIVSQHQDQNDGIPQVQVINQKEINVHLVEEEKIEEGQDEIPSLPSNDQPQGTIKRLRGIKTTMKIVERYITEVFTRVNEQVNEFVENLSSPLNKDPLEILMHLQNVYLDAEMEAAVAFQQSVLPVDTYLELERNKIQVMLNDSSMDEADEDNKVNTSTQAEWENIHNKVIFDGINEALDNFRPYGLRGPPMPWSQQTRTLTYRNGQQIELVLTQVRQKVMEWARTFAGALPCSELLKEYGIRGPLEEEKLNLLREERLALVLASEIEENEMLWTDYEYEETQTKLDVADMILEFLAEETGTILNKLQEQKAQVSDTTTSTIQQ